MGILKKHHLPAALIGTGNHQAGSAILTLIKNKCVLSAFWAWDRKRSPAAGAEFFVFGYLPQTGRAQDCKWVPSAASCTEPGIRINKRIAENAGLFIGSHVIPLSLLELSAAFSAKPCTYGEFSTALRTF